MSKFHNIRARSVVFSTCVLASCLHPCLCSNIFSFSALSWCDLRQIRTSFRLDLTQAMMWGLCIDTFCRNDIDMSTLRHHLILYLSV